MVEYTMTLGDIERGMDHVETGSVYNTTVTAVAESKSSRGWFWKLCVVLLVVAFSATTALIFAWNQHGRKTTIQDTMESHKLKVSGAEDVPLKLKQIGDQAKAAIHVEGEYSRDVLDDSLQWRLDEGQAFSQGMLELKGNQIVIPHTGLYFVYSQASFRVKCHDSGNQAVTLNLRLPPPATTTSFACAETSGKQ
ncbi:hypothetical protein DPEC_G00351560 [Dallia pectoralis]|uniref:Uncharacterized protein n=1 Tax=Dallia pectoralis TaxID=75939 RepID=A0ACC2F1Z2_DALPE|nr:hypothetical protein DPEC_G00351560 [Dallia pectoralis]